MAYSVIGLFDRIANLGFRPPSSYIRPESTLDRQRSVSFHSSTISYLFMLLSLVSTFQSEYVVPRVCYTQGDR